MMEIVRKFLSEEELQPADTRYDDVTDEVQYSPDGGTTWLDAPGLDPRITNNLPPPGTADPTCDAAARIQAHFEQILATVIVGASSAVIAVAGRVIGLFMPQFAILITFVSTIVGGLIGLGAEALAEAFLGGEWETFICILKCNMSEDGTINDAQLTEIREDVDNQIGGTAAAALQFLMTMTGVGGMNAAASQRDETGDCSGCECGWCVVWDFTVNNGGFSITGGPGSYVASVGWVGAFQDANSQTTIQIEKLFSDCNITAMTVQYRKDGGSGPNNSKRAFVYKDGNLQAQASNSNNGNPVGLLVPIPGGDVGADRLLVDINTGGSAATAIILSVTIEGYGIKPTGGEDC